VLAASITRGLVRSGRLSTLRASIDDQPGVLAKLLTVIGEAGGNLLELQHQRLAAGVPIRSVDVDLCVETMDAGHRDRVLDALAGAGYAVTLLPTG
jgi:threonine dehydratase